MSLAKALLALQKEAAEDEKFRLIKGTAGQFGNYLDLHEINEKITPLLAAHNLTWTSRPTGTHAAPMLSYELMWEQDGSEREIIAGDMPLFLPERPTSQAFGSAITYARRYAKLAVLDLVGDEDDDGKKASDPAPAFAQKDRSGYGQMPETGEAATDPQKKKIRGDLSRAGAKGWDIQHAIYRELFGKDLPQGKDIADVVTKAQAGRVIDRVKQGALPTGVSDVPDEGAPTVEQPKLGDDEGVPF